MRSFIGSQTFSSTLGISLYKWPKAYTSFCISSFFRNFSFFPLNVRVLNLRWYLVHWQLLFWQTTLHIFLHFCSVGVYSNYISLKNSIYKSCKTSGPFIVYETNLPFVTRPCLVVLVLASYWLSASDWFCCSRLWPASIRNTCVGCLVTCIFRRGHRVINAYSLCTALHVTGFEVLECRTW